MDDRDGFYTLSGYLRQDGEALTAAMEDYLEMICRAMAESGAVRLKELARRLHVRPSSASKMVAHLGKLGYLDAERYGRILVTEKGFAAGNYLLYRHRALTDFFRLLNQTEDELELVEKIEHFIDRRTLENLAGLTDILSNWQGNRLD